MSTVTNSPGRAVFNVSGVGGTYILTVKNVVKSGYMFDSGGSRLTKSITK
jgi:hypothetical protein